MRYPVHDKHFYIILLITTFWFGIALYLSVVVFPVFSFCGDQFDLNTRLDLIHECQRRAEIGLVIFSTHFLPAFIIGSGTNLLSLLISWFGNIGIISFLVGFIPATLAEIFLLSHIFSRLWTKYHTFQPS